MDKGWDTLVQSLEEPATVIDSNYIYLSTNRAHLLHAGQAKENVIGRHISEVLGGARFREIKPHLDLALQSGKSTYRYQPDAGPGGYQYVEVENRRLKVPGREDYLVFSTLHDSTEAELARQKLQLVSNAISYSTEMICVLGEDHRYQLANQGYLNLMQLQEEQLIGRHVGDVMNRAAYENHFRPVLDTALEKGAASLKITRDWGGNQAIELEVICYRVPNPRGTGYCLACVGRDITERKKTEDALRLSEEKFARAFDVGPDLMNINSLDDGNIVEMNNRVEAILGWKKSEVVGRTALDINFWHDVKQRDELLRQLDINGEVQNMEIVAVRKNGERFPALLSAAKVVLGGKPHGVFMTRDITFLKDVEYELTRHREHLEQLVRERTYELEAAQEKLLRKEKLATLGQLTGTVAHELRNPLGTVQASLYLVGELSGEDERLQRAIERATRNSKRCNSIIEELLNFARTSPLDIQPVKIDKWIDDLVGEFDCPEGIEIFPYIPGNIVLTMDAEGVRRCLINLLTNAVQAISSVKRQTKGKINIRAGKNGKWYEISVHDNGPGIPPGQLNKITEPLYSTRGFGVGLGLSIVEQIIEQHGGQMKIVPLESSGTRVSLYFPLSAVVR